ncbi:MAG: acyl-CoA dehydrogenase family protein, partial [Actinomycetota bacterium]|nr:acyl-CoA dehydrogenase family protein [Actinomycetota bacterium]
MTTTADTSAEAAEAELTAEDAAFVDSVASALDDLLPRRSPDDPTTVLGAGNDDLTPGREYLQLLSEGGWAVPMWPREYGGMGLDAHRGDLVRECLRRYRSPDLYPFMVRVSLVGPTLIAHASPDQQARWLPRIRSGEDIWCQMFSEPDAGSDLANLKARAIAEGDTWRVTGSKVWTSRAHYSERGLLLARSDPSLAKHAGIIAFGVDMSAPGIEVRPLVQMNRDAHFNEVFLDDVVIPDSDRIGAIGDGWRVGITCLSHERGSLAGGLGVSFEQLVGLAHRYDLAHRPVLRDRLLKALIELRIGQWTALRAQAARQAGRAPGPEDSGA